MTPLPPNLPPPPPGAYPVAPPAGGRSGAGCFLKGCGIVLAVFLLLGLLGGAVTFFGLRKLRDTFTSDRPVPVRVFPVTDAQLADVNARLARFQEALGRGEEATLSLSADDLNILVARDPSYAAVRGKVFFTIPRDELQAEVSYPLNDLPRVAQMLVGANRWFNGRARLDVGYADGEPHLHLLGLETNGQKVNEAFVEGFDTSFNREFQKSFRRQREKNPGGASVWERLESIEIKDGKIVAVAGK